jgi:uncharacterized protein (DUF4415 family)
MSNRISSKASADAGERDEAPPLGKHFFATGALKAGEITLRPATDTMARRGRPPQGSAAKVQQSLRLSPEVLDHFRGTGKGWQARIDEVLRHVVELERAIALAGALPASTSGGRKMKEDLKRFHDLILGGGARPAEGIDPRFAEMLERIVRATATMLGMSIPTASEIAQRPKVRGKDQYVIPHRGGWAVKGAGNERATSVHDTQAEAIDRAREIALHQGGELVVHRPTGQIRGKDGASRQPRNARRH